MTVPLILKKACLPWHIFRLSNSWPSRHLVWSIGSVLYLLIVQSSTDSSISSSIFLHAKFSFILLRYRNFTMISRTRFVTDFTWFHLKFLERSDYKTS